MVMLLIVFAVLTWWSIKRRNEYLGYGLGWLIGVFVMVVYGALFGNPEPAVTAPDVVPASVTLNIFQVILPSFIGIVMGAGMMLLVNQTQDSGARQSIVVAILTAIALIVLFLMVVSAYNLIAQRMIGLFALAFAIGAATILVITRSVGNPLSASAQGLPTDNNAKYPPIIPGNDTMGNRIRDRIERRRRG